MARTKTKRIIKRIYLDNGATTKIAEEVLIEMQKYMIRQYGNASSLHIFGRDAKEALEKARAAIAKAINAETNEIIFTSGGTESNNLAIRGMVENAISQRQPGSKLPEIITSTIEHPSVLKTCKQLEKQKKAKITLLQVNSEGIINLENLKKAINKDTILVTIMHANNEIGTIQPINEIGKICAEKKVSFHTDAIQSFTKTELDTKKQNIGMAAFSAHKIHGPKGVGALYIKKELQKKIVPQITGGGHEFGLRAGTENIPGMAGFAKAVQLCNKKHNKQMQELRDHLLAEIPKRIPDVIINGPKLGDKRRLCNNANFSIKYIEGESLVLLLDQKGIAASTGSACSQKTLQPSHVLRAIGLAHEVAHGSLRLTISRYTTKEEIKYAIDCIEEITRHLRKISPLTKIK